MSKGGVETRLVQSALEGDREAIRRLADLLTPVVHTRVARVLLGAGEARSERRDLRQDVADFTQEVFLALFDHDARALRSWDASRGLSLQNFVGVVAEHQAISLLRSGRRNPWTEEPMACDELDQAVGTVDADDARVYSREVLTKLLERLRAELSPNGLLLFQWLLVEERAPLDVCKQTGMTMDALYAWRSRLGKLVRRLADDLDGTSPPPADIHRKSAMKREQGDAP